MKPGDTYTLWTHTTGLAVWNRFAAVSGEFSDVHMDDEAARAVGNAQGAFGMGSLRLSYIVHGLLETFGSETQIEEIECRYAGVNQKHDELMVVATVEETKALDDGRISATFTVNVLNQRGESICPGRVRLSRREQR